MSELVVYQTATAITQAIPELPDQYEYFKQADALRKYFKDPKMAIAWLEAQAAMAMTVEQMRENGELATNRDGRDRSVTLTDLLGVSEDSAECAYRRWSKVAEIPEPDRATYYAESKIPSQRGLIGWWTRKQRRPWISPDECGIYQTDFRELDVADDSIALIFTDPPYARSDADLYGDLAEFAKRVLMPGGSLIAYSGQTSLPKILADMSKHLRFWWLCGCYHSGNPTRMTELGIINHWKPLIWLVKDTRRDRMTFVDDVVSGGSEKTDHDWQQAQSEAEYFIDFLTISGEMVFDPFVGSGTTCIAARKLGRNWIGCDTDPDAVQKARAGVNGQPEKATV